MIRTHVLMASAGIAGLLTSFAPQALAQQLGGSYSTSQGGSYYGGGLPQQSDVDNIGAEDGMFVFGFDRVSSLALDRQKLTYGDDDQFEYTYSSTALNLLGSDASSPSQMPRFALDYVISAGVTAGVFLGFSTRALELEGSGNGTGTDEPPQAPASVRAEGVTFLGGARLGYAYAIDETFGIWPRAGLSFATSSGEYTAVVDQTTGATQTFDTSSRYLDLDLEVLGVISPVEHTAIMVGPYLDLGLSGKYDAERPANACPSGESPPCPDERNIKLTSFGLVIHAVGYY